MTTFIKAKLKKQMNSDKYKKIAENYIKRKKLIY